MTKPMEVLAGSSKNVRELTEDRFLAKDRRVGDSIL
jgi:hypothetical protein